MSNPDYWQEKFPEMEPCAKPPGLFTVNGFGTMVHGRRDYDTESNTYVKTLCFTILFVPLFALRAYRVADAPQGWYFIGKVPLSGLARGWNFLMLASIVLGTAGFF